MSSLCRYASIGLWLMVIALIGFWVLGAQAAESSLSQGQTVYVPVYSQVYFGNQARTLDLSVTLSIRNIDAKNSINLTKIAYYDEQGKHLRDFLEKPVEIKPWNSTRVFIKQSDISGGAEAFFIVVWQAAGKVNPPIIDGIMIGASGQQGISFTSRGTPIDRRD
jgi:hypothetical protein